MDGALRATRDRTCGPFALEHALVTIGQLADEQSIAGVAHPHGWASTNEVERARAARHFDCDLPLVRRTDAERARNAPVCYVSQGLPVIMRVDQVDRWDHWISVVRHEGDRFVLLASRREPVVQVMDWHGHLERGPALRALRNLRFVAETYGLVVPESSARQALVELAVLLALWAAASAGVDALYGSDLRPRGTRQR